MKKQKPKTKPKATARPRGASAVVAKELDPAAVWIWNSPAGQVLVGARPALLHSRLARYFNDRQMLVELNAECAAMREKGESILFIDNPVQGRITHPQVAIRTELMRRMRKSEESLDITMDEVEEMEESEATEGEGARGTGDARQANLHGRATPGDERARKGAVAGSR